MKALAPADQAAVRKASLLLRLARASNLARSSAVRSTRLGVRDGAVRLQLIPRGKMSVNLELWAIEKETDYFRELFGRELSAAT